MIIEHLNKNNSGFNEVKLISQYIDYIPNYIFDIGSNIGNFSISFADIYKNSNIFSFEPVKVTYDILEKNTNEYSNIYTFNFGLSDVDIKNVPIGMPIIPTNRTHNYGRATTYGFDGEPIDFIELKSTSKFCIDNNAIPDIIKIDAEGAEFSIINDMLSNNILSHVNYIYIEINNHYNTKESAQKSKQILNNFFDIIHHSGHNNDNGEPLNYLYKRKI